MRSQTAFEIRQAILAGDTHYYIDEGSGPPLVLVHGSLCDCRYWDAQIKALRAHFRVIAPSLRHYWPARWDGLGAGFTVAQHAHDVRTLLRHLDVARAHWVGHSRGGRVALEAALTDASALMSLTLADPGVVFTKSAAQAQDTGHQSPTLDRREDFRAIAARHIAEGRIDEGLAVFVDAVTGPQTWQRMVPWFKAMAHDNAATVLGQIREVPEPVAESALQRLALSCLLVGGALSPPPYPDILARLHALLPDSDLHMIAGSSHGMNIGNPRAFNRCIEQFLLGD